MNEPPLTAGERTVSPDVRDDLRQRREPFTKIMSTVARIQPGCPMHDSIAEGVKNILLSLDGVNDVEVQLVWDPPWHPSMMPEPGRQLTGVKPY
jgi:metal-sulfur cluster biosynthetic enzyme